MHNFFSAYFHQDFLYDAGTTDAVVAEYARSATARDVRSVAEAILDYSKRFYSDQELEQALFKELGCYYRPSATGLSARAWLEGVANQLLKEAQ